MIKRDETQTSDSTAFPVVGIGASAGGLEAFRELLSALPLDTGMAFVLLQHLSPDHSSQLAELLADTTSMPVKPAKDGQQLQADHVYIVPPATQPGLLHGRLQLLPLHHKPGAPVVIDEFFKSLATDAGPKAVGVILSGAGSDGGGGLEAIRAAGGVAFAQSEHSAAFDSMPHSAIERGLADYVLPPTAIASELGRLARSPRFTLGKRQQLPFASSRQSLQKLFLLLRQSTGTDFSLYKPSTIQRRLQRRLMLHHLNRLADYLKLIQQQPEELEHLFDDLLINVTHFFREAESFRTLEQSVFPALVEQKRQGEPIRIWVPACSSGEEAYSVAITWLDFLEQAQIDRPLQLFATDIDAAAIKQARRGIFAPDQVVPHLSRRRLEYYFNRTPQGCQINPEVRDLCVFSVQDLLCDPPFSRIDLICCRNLLIYLKRKPQQQLLQTLHRSLNPTGFLMLGGSESIGASSDLFQVADKRTRLYHKKTLPGELSQQFLRTKGSLPLEPVKPVSDPPTPNSAEMAISTLRERRCPPGVTLDRTHNILAFHGDVSPYLTHPPGRPDLKLLRMVQGELRTELNLMVYRVIESAKAETRTLRHTMPDGQQHTISLSFEPVPRSDHQEPLFLLLFQDLGRCETPSPAADGSSDSRIAELEQELTRVWQHTEQMILQLRATNEELHTVSEENLSANEELQSTNEELETAKEELQSSNEELSTLNHELLAANEELHRLNEELRQLLESVELPILMLTRELRLRRYTPAALRLFNLLPGDLNRPLSDLQPRFHSPSLEAELHDVIHNRQSRTLGIEDGERNPWSLSILPFFDEQGALDGLVLRFIDLRPYRELEQHERLLLTFLQNSGEAVILEDLNGTILSWNRGAERLYGYSADEAVGMSVFKLIPAEEQPPLREIIGRLALNEEVQPFETWRIGRDGSRHRIRLSLSVVRDAHGQPVSLASTGREISD
ncbi:PAS domain S-box [endosymbiont of Ridgeia piscesae]|jgi:two-component system CheB/CheR fusion protein|uniref:protein-glutamate O-methyltransferase n=3 Tax=endosymbiont of Ridgeia piscesae TaxID=54398 RepID=A0A0T5YZ30_9GAMM|nr:chemotaxis protein CheB [endosymbiont of Ridgeia piscesae]KRT55895.1 PAS domain S-box [endosymbiont of Ridgeia piscesae]